MSFFGKSVIVLKRLEWKWMVPCMITIPITIVILLTGCDEFWQKGDVIIQDMNEVATSARVILESPAGAMIPPPWKLYGALGVILANGLVITWEEMRNRTMKKTTTAIVKGVEQTSNPDKATSEIKSNIAEEMMKQGGDRFYTKANKIVDQLKIS